MSPRPHLSAALLTARHHQMLAGALLADSARTASPHDVASAHAHATAAIAAVAVGVLADQVHLEAEAPEPQTPAREAWSRDQ